MGLMMIKGDVFHRILGENIETTWVTFAWRLALSMFTVRVRGLLCRTASAYGVSTGAVLGRGCLHARCVQTVLGSRRAENCDFFTVAVSARWLMSLLVQFIDGRGCPVLMQRRRGSCWRCLSSVHRRGWWTFQVQRLWASSRVGGGEGVGAHHTGDELN